MSLALRTEVDATTPTPPTRADNRLTRWAAALARPPLWCTLAVCAAILVWRRTDAFHTPQFWAEDGEIFFAQSRMLGSAALLEPSAGYLHTALRLVAWLASWFDPTLAPAIFVAAAATLTLYVAARTQSTRFPLPPSIGYALAVVMVPDASEVLLTLTNLQWVLAGGLLLILLAKDAETRAQSWHDILGTILLGLTGPFVIALAPLFVWRAYQRRSRFSVDLAALAVLCAAVQAMLISRYSIEATKAHVALDLLLALPGVRLGGSLLTGGFLGAGTPVVIGITCGVLTLVGLAVLAFRGGAARRERIWLGLACLALLAMALYRCRHVIPTVYSGWGSRYFFPLQLIALWLVVAMAADSPRRFARIGVRLLAWIFVVNVWRLREPAAADLNWPEYAARIKRGEQVTVRINPEGWSFTMPGNDEGLPIGPTVRSGLVNVSARCFVTPEQPAMVGFTLPTGNSRQLLVRAIGPSLSRFGVARPLARPELTLMHGHFAVENFQPRRNGADDPAIASATTRCLAFALEQGTADLAGLVHLPRGVYTLVVSGGEGRAGEVLVEIYEVPAER